MLLASWRESQSLQCVYISHYIISAKTPLVQASYFSFGFMYYVASLLSTVDDSKLRACE